MGKWRAALLPGAGTASASLLIAQQLIPCAGRSGVVSALPDPSQSGCSEKDVSTHRIVGVLVPLRQPQSVAQPGFELTAVFLAQPTLGLLVCTMASSIWQEGGVVHCLVKG